MELKVIEPDWPAPANVRAFTTTREGGCSEGPWRSLNLGLNCGDDPVAVRRNRDRLERLFPAPPQWLNQVHGTRVAVHPGSVVEKLEADALVTTGRGRVCAVLTADCLPVFFCDASGSQVAVAHAGWRGLAAGILQRVVKEFDSNPGRLMAWLGPAIGPSVYEVQDDMKNAFEPEFSTCFIRQGDHWLFDIYQAARKVLHEAGVSSVSGGDFCTFTETELFFSFRRDGRSGRMASLIWIE